MFKAIHLSLVLAVLFTSCKKDDSVAPVEDVEVHIFELSQNRGMLGDPLIITGAGFGTDPKVYFNDVPAEVLSHSPNQISTVVPLEAHSGPIIVTYEEDSARSIHFDVMYSLMDAMIRNGELVQTSGGSRNGEFGFEFSSSTNGHIMGLGLITSRSPMDNPNYEVSIWDVESSSLLLEQKITPVVYSSTESNLVFIDAFAILANKRYRISVSGPGTTYIYSSILETVFRDLTIHHSVRNSNGDDNLYPDEAFDSYLMGLPDIIFLPEQ